MASMLPPNTPIEKSELLTMFKPQSGIEVKILDEKHDMVPPGEVGHLLIRSPFTMQGFLDNKELTDQIKPRHGWVETGDLGIVTNDGYVKVVGRTRDVISRGSSKIYPQTLEKMISAHPKVDKVVVVGVPDAKFLNEVCACIIAKKDTGLSQDELNDFCEEQTIGPDSLLKPKYYYFMKQFPSGITGKVDRKAVCEQAVAHLGLK